MLPENIYLKRTRNDQRYRKNVLPFYLRRLYVADPFVSIVYHNYALLGDFFLGQDN